MTDSLGRGVVPQTPSAGARDMASRVAEQRPFVDGRSWPFSELWKTALLFQLYLD